MKTPTKILNEYVLPIEQFSSIGEAQTFIRENKAPDYLVIDSILYTMDEYDNDGKEITYYNKRTGNALRVWTDNRYHDGFGDAQVELLENYGVWRNDITYAD